MKFSKRHKLIISIICALLLCTSCAITFDYESEWKEVDGMAEVFPQNAIKKTLSIKRHAIKEKNRIQLLKAILYQFHLGADHIGYTKKDSEEDFPTPPGCYNNQVPEAEDSSLIAYMDEIQAFRMQEKETGLHSLSTFFLAKTLHAYYQIHKDDGINLLSSDPEKMSEWSKEAFQDTILKLCKEALAPVDRLSKTKTTNYNVLITQGKDSRKLRSSLYDFLCYEIINSRLLLEAKFNNYKIELLQSMVNLHKNDKDKSNLISTSIDLIEANNDLSFVTHFDEHGTPLTPPPPPVPYKTPLSQIEKNTLNDLKGLLSQYKSEEASLLIIPKIADLYLYKEELKNDSVYFYIKDLCKEGRALFPKSEYAHYLDSVVINMDSPFLSFNMEKNPHSGDKIKIKVTYANLENLDLEIRKYKPTNNIKENDDNDEDEENSDSYEYKKKISEPIKQIKIKLAKTRIPKDTIIEIDSLDFGHYLIYSNKIQQNDYNYFPNLSDFYVSDLELIKAELRNKTIFFVTDSKTGYPIKDVTATFSNEKEEKQILKTDQNGYVEASSDKYENVRFSVGRDSFSEAIHYYHPWNRDKKEENEQEDLTILTDRNIYRPGQTIYYKVILSKLKKNNENKVFSGKNINVYFYSGNDQIIEKVTLKTNEFGSASGSFVIPANCASGIYSIYIDDCYKSFRIEEYKRPSFEIKLNEPQIASSNKDSFVISGSAKYLTDVPLRKAQVRYIITEEFYFPWYESSNNASKRYIQQGSIQTNEKGEFSIGINPSKKERDHSFTITTEITDANGETQAEEAEFSINSKSLNFDISLEEITNSESLCKKPISVTNILGKELEMNISYSIESEQSDKKIKGNIHSNKEGLAYLPSDIPFKNTGKYKIIFKGIDNKGKEVCNTFTTVIFNKTTKRPPIESPLWVENPEQNNQNEVSFRFGSSFEDAKILYAIENKYGIIKKEWVNVNNEIKGFHFSPNSKDEEQLRFHFYIIKEGKIYSKERDIFINKQAPINKDLNVKLSIFRDKTTPGAKETWTLNVDSKKEAEVLVSMYDEALDKIAPSNWKFSPIWEKSEHEIDFYWKETPISSYEDYNYINFNIYPEVHHIRNLRFDHFIDIIENIDIGRRMIVCQEQSMMDYKEDIPPINNNDKSYRYNFAETAFFYPQLRTDSIGNVTFSFQMQESLTRWKFRALAHTKDLFYGQTIESIVARKDFMISPNVPRFVRQGDRCVFSAKILNLSNKPIKGTATIELADAMEDKTIIQKEVSFSADANGSTSAYWDIEIPQDKDLLVLRIKGKTNNLIDGEQHLLTVLPNHTVITQTLPIFVRDGEKSKFTFKQMKENQSSTQQNKFLKIEFTSNPV